MNRSVPQKCILWLLTLCCLACAGCSFKLAASPDDLYCLPQLPAEYTELNSCIKALLDGGAEYAAPVSGTNIQPVQLVDLDGDGQEEAVAFLRRSADEQPLKIYIYSRRDQTYEQTALIEGVGSSIYSVAYSDLDQDGRRELLVGWKVGAELQVLTVYALRPGETEELMSVSYVRYAVTDLNGSGARELVVFHADEAGGGVADYYLWNGSGAMTRGSSARLSMTMAELSAGQVVSGGLRDGANALFVAGVGDSRVEITDILTLRGGELTNVTLSDRTGVSTEIYRYYSLFPADINGDGVTEVPAPLSLPVWQGDTENLCYRIEWRSYDSGGVSQTALSTYHDTDSGWYLELPEAWIGRISAARIQTGPEETAVVFYRTEEDGDRVPPREFLRIDTLTGENRETLAVRGGRVILSRTAQTIYAAELSEVNGDWEHGVTEDALRERFHLITSGWTAGDN